MLKAREIAKYFLNKDKEQRIFTKNLIERNGRTFYEGNIRLNNYIHMAQNLYIAKCGKKLFADDLYAYDNGAVAVDVQENYAILLNWNKETQFEDDIRDFLDRVYIIFQNATLDELIALSHEDSEWVAKHSYASKQEQKMDSLARMDEYREQYKDILRVMERLPIYE